MSCSGHPAGPRLHSAKRVRSVLHSYRDGTTCFSVPCFDRIERILEASFTGPGTLATQRDQDSINASLATESYMVSEVSGRYECYIPERIRSVATAACGPFGLHQGATEGMLLGRFASFPILDGAVPCILPLWLVGTICESTW